MKGKKQENDRFFIRYICSHFVFFDLVNHNESGRIISS